jgi:hypothetical protein
MPLIRDYTACGELRRQLLRLTVSRSQPAVSAELLKAIFPVKKAVRLLGVSISGFSAGDSEQIGLAL